MQMKTTIGPGVEQQLVKSSVKWFLFSVGLLLASIGAYLILSGAIILKTHEVLPGMLDMLVGFVFVSSGWRMIQARTFGKAS